MSVALKFHNVKKQFDKLEALKGVSLEIKEGEFFALLGQNGAGKTTLINCLAGVTKRDSGEIEVLGKNIDTHSTFAKTSVGIVAQEVAFDPFFGPAEILRMQRGMYGLRQNEEHLDWLLEKLSLQDKKNVRSRKLSGGMRRRLMIAKALVHEPKILILDEPTAGVDVELRQGLWKFLEELRQKHGVTILLTTHYLEEAQALADRIAIIHKGEIIVNEEKKQLLKRQKRILEIETTDGKTESFELESDENPLIKLGQRTDIKDLTIREPKLEDVFLDLTKA